MGLLDASLFSYKRVLQLNPESHTALYNIANNLFELGRQDEAIAYYERCLQINPEKIVAMNRLAACYLRMGVPGKALEWSSKAMALANDVVIKSNHALALSANEQYEKALSVCNEIKDESYYYHFVHSQIMYKLKKYDEALKEIESILEVGALDYDLAVQKFYCLTALNQINDAKNWIKEIEERYPFRADDYNNIGYQLMNEFNLKEEAVGLFRKAVELSPRTMVAWNNLQACLGGLGALEEALKACDDALAINPFDSKSVKNKYLTLILNNRLDEAIHFIFGKTFGLVGAEDTAAKFEESFIDIFRRSGINLAEISKSVRDLYLLQQKLNKGNEDKLPP
jgi:tetratricopeptide (TPR) repeat protein